MKTEAHSQCCYSKFPYLKEVDVMELLASATLTVTLRGFVLTLRAVTRKPTVRTSA